MPDDALTQDSLILLAGMAAPKPAFFYAAIDDILARRAGDASFGVQLEADVGRLHANDRAATQAFAAILRQGGFDGACELPLMGKAAGEWAAASDALRDKRPSRRREGAWLLPLARAGVIFDDGDLMRAAARREGAPLQESLWIFRTLATRRSLGAAELKRLGACAKELIHGRLLDEFDPNPSRRRPHDTPSDPILAAEAALELHRLGLAEASDLSSCLARAAMDASVEACAALGAGGARWDGTLGIAGNAFAAGLALILSSDRKAPARYRAAAAFAELLASLGAAEDFDHLLNFDPRSARKLSLSPHIAALEKAASLDAEPGERSLALALSSRLGSLGFHIDAGRGLALGVAARTAFEPILDEPDFSLFNLALRAGADPLAAGSELLSAPAPNGWRGLRAQACGTQASLDAWLVRLARLGISPADLPATGELSESPFGLAAESPSSFGYARALIEAGAPAEWMDPHTARSAATFIAPHGDDPEAVELLAIVARALAAAGRLDLVSTDSKKPGSPLMIACGWGRPESVEALLDAGADPNIADPLGRRAAHMIGQEALISGRHAHSDARSLSIAKALEAAGADFGARCFHGSTPAQALAAAAPLDLLDFLFSGRPHDIAADEPRAHQARADLMGRGPQGIAIAERAELGALHAHASPPTRGAQRV